MTFLSTPLQKQEGMFQRCSWVSLPTIVRGFLLPFVLCFPSLPLAAVAWDLSGICPCENEMQLPLLRKKGLGMCARCYCRKRKVRENALFINVLAPFGNLPQVVLYSGSSRSSFLFKKMSRYIPGMALISGGLGIVDLIFGSFFVTIKKSTPFPF